MRYYNPFMNSMMTNMDWYGGFHQWGYPKSWMVFVRENPIYKLMMTGYPHFRKPPYGPSDPDFAKSAKDTKLTNTFWAKMHFLRSIFDKIQGVECKQLPSTDACGELEVWAGWNSLIPEFRTVRSVVSLRIRRRLSCRVVLDDEL